MYYNPESNTTIGFSDLKLLLNASIPVGTEEIDGWYFVHDGDHPNVDEFHSVTLGPVMLMDGKYTQTYQIVDKNLDELLAKYRVCKKQTFFSAQASLSTMYQEALLDGDEATMKAVRSVHAKNETVLYLIETSQDLDELRNIDILDPTPGTLWECASSIAFDASIE